MPRRPKPKSLPAFLRETIYGQDDYGRNYWGALWDVLSNPQHRDHDLVVDVVGPLIEKGGRNEAVVAAIERFNSRFQGRPQSWGLAPQSGGLDWHVPGEWDASGDDIEVVPSDDVIPSTYEALRALLLSAPSRRRLKRCPECLEFFFDVSKRDNAIYNTPTCAARVRMRKRYRKLAHPEHP